MEVRADHRRLISGQLLMLGAMTIHRPTADWECPHHLGRLHKEAMQLTYCDSDTACSSCARAWLKDTGEMYPLLDGEILEPFESTLDLVGSGRLF